MGHLYVGIGRRRITPKIGGHLAGYGTDVFSTSVHDDLTATTLVLQQNDLTAIWICETVCNLSGALVDEIKSEIRKKHPVPAENIMIAAIHTHSGPIVNSGAGWGDVDREYCDSIFIPQTLAAVDEAFSQMREAYMGVQETESLVGINRREYGPDGVVDFGQNPWGQQDKRMTVIAFQTPDGASIANVVHYGAHCTAAGTNTEITRDWAGVMIDRLEAESGAPTLFLNGAAGDVGPRLTTMLWNLAVWRRRMRFGPTGQSAAITRYTFKLSAGRWRFPMIRFHPCVRRRPALQNTTLFQIQTCIFGCGIITEESFVLIRKVFPPKKQRRSTRRSFCWEMSCWFRSALNYFQKSASACARTAHIHIRLLLAMPMKRLVICHRKIRSVVVVMR